MSKFLKIRNILSTIKQQYQNVYNFDTIDKIRDKVYPELTAHDRLGAKLVNYNLIGDTLVIISEYLPNKLSEDYIINNENNIFNWIKEIHNLGIYHGDLHTNNIMLNQNLELKLIDLETLFYKDKLDTILINEWCEIGFNMTLEEFILYEETENFKTNTD